MPGTSRHGFSEDLQHVRAGSQPNAYATIRNLVTGAFRRAGFANTAHARRYYGRDDKRILALYGIRVTDIKTTGPYNTSTPGPWPGTSVCARLRTAIADRARSWENRPTRNREGRGDGHR